MTRSLSILFAIAVGCGGSQTTEPDTVQMKEDTLRDLQAEERTERRPPPTRPTPPEEELAVEMFDLAAGEPARAASGLEVRLTSGAPQWAFRFDHHGRQSTVRHVGDPLYLEGVVFGHLYVINRVGEAVQLTLRSDVPDNPLSPESALVLARSERQARLECEGSREVTEVADNGTVILRILDPSGQETCRVVVGRYTQEIVGF